MDEMDEGTGSEPVKEDVKIHQRSMGGSSKKEARRQLGKNESFDDWIKRKAEKKSQTAGSRDGKRKGFLRRSKLSPVSKKQKKKLSEYQKSRNEHYSKEENRVCFICGQSNNLSIHHESKRGSNISNQETFITLCLTGDYLNRLHPTLNQAEGCHNFVEKNKGWAREKGYLS